MFKSNDLFEKSVYNCNGKIIGRVKEIVIDFFNGKICGFGVKNSKNSEKINFISVNEGEPEISGELCKRNDGILFSVLRKMMVVDRAGNKKGIIEDLIIDKDNLEIKALLLESNEINNVLSGNEIILMRNAELKDGYILDVGNSNVTLKNMSHEINRYNHKARA